MNVKKTELEEEGDGIDGDGKDGDEDNEDDDNSNDKGTDEEVDSDNDVERRQKRETTLIRSDND